MRIGAFLFARFFGATNEASIPNYFCSRRQQRDLFLFETFALSLSLAVLIKPHHFQTMFAHRRHVWKWFYLIIFHTIILLLVVFWLRRYSLRRRKRISHEGKTMLWLFLSDWTIPVLFLLSISLLLSCKLARDVIIFSLSLHISLRPGKINAFSVCVCVRFQCVFNYLFPTKVSASTVEKKSFIALVAA